MSDGIQITIRNEKLWKPDFIFVQLCDMLDALERPHFRDVLGGAVQRLRLDPDSRFEDDNRIAPKGKGKGKGKGKDDPNKKISKRRGFSKGLAMEVVVASLLTWLDHPKQVRAYWKINRNGLPNHAAPARKPDLLFSPMDAQPPFQIVCEVSANRGLNAQSFTKQLESALTHCKKIHGNVGEGVTYGFLVNHGRIAQSRMMQTVYRRFVKDKQLKRKGPIRLVSMRNRDFASVLRQLRGHGELRFDTRLLPRALDALHVRLRDKKKIPKGTQWMVKVFVDTIKAGMQAQQDLFDPEVVRT